jgi:hypothetical protein
MYTPLRYGSKEYIELRKTEKRRTYRKTIDGRRTFITHTTAARPGLWVSETAELFEVEVPGKPLGIMGISASVTELVATGPTEAIAIERARAKWAAGK